MAEESRSFVYAAHWLSAPGSSQNLWKACFAKELFRSGSIYQLASMEAFPTHYHRGPGKME
jgi:hypothetical protein